MGPGFLEENEVTHFSPWALGGSQKVLVERTGTIRCHPLLPKEWFDKPHPDRVVGTSCFLSDLGVPVLGDAGSLAHSFLSQLALFSCVENSEVSILNGKMWLSS